MIFLGAVPRRVGYASDGRRWMLTDSITSVDRSRHFGLQLMRERAGLCGGELHIRTTPDRGTKIVATIPLQIASEGSAKSS